MRERETDRDRENETDRQTDRQTDREKERESGCAVPAAPPRRALCLGRDA